MLERMASDRLWIYTGIVGSLFGAAFLFYFQSTRAGIWVYGWFDKILDYLVDRWGLKWFEQPTDAWRTKYPHITKKLDELEKRISNLEEK